MSPLQNFASPYPSKEDRAALIAMTGLTNSQVTVGVRVCVLLPVCSWWTRDVRIHVQVTNWLVNARARHWRPLVNKLDTPTGAGDSHGGTGDGALPQADV